MALCQRFYKSRRSRKVQVFAQMADFAVTDVCDNTNSHIEVAAIRQYAADVVFLDKSCGRT